MADGVSACKNSRIGAQIACEVCADILLDHVRYYFDSGIEKVKNILLMNIRSAIEKRAKSDHCKSEDYASTLAFLCFDKLGNQVMTFSLGDSRIYHIDDSGIKHINQTIIHEQNLVCATISYCAEKEAVVRRSGKQETDKFLLCTDGMWKTAESDSLFDAPEMFEDGNAIAQLLSQQQINDDCSFLLAA